jgi:hypothetical protein
MIFFTVDTECPGIPRILSGMQHNYSLEYIIRASGYYFRRH